MRAHEILEHYSDEDLQRLARDKIEEVANIRLPRQVVLQEIASALSSMSYVAKVLAPARPPTYAFLKLLLDEGDHVVDAHGFRSRVLALTDALTERVAAGKGLSREKDYELYLRVLYAAWEDDGRIDRSEALLLGALRTELRLSMREHLLLEHHPLVRPIWDEGHAYEEARNHLLSTGLVLVHEGDRYVVPEEVALQVRRVWEIDLDDAAYTRLLEQLTTTQLRNALGETHLPLSGSKAERVERLVRALVPPIEVLDTLHIRDVKELCRRLGLPVSGKKSGLMQAVVDHFAEGRDLEPEAMEESAAPPEPVASEPRQLDDEGLTRLLGHLTVDLLYDLLASHDLRVSGSKAERIERLVASSHSEEALLAALRRSDLVGLCRRLGVPVSGVKRELVDRVIEWARSPVSETEEAPAPELETASEAERTESAARQETAREKEAVPAPEVRAPEGIDEIREHFPELEPDEQQIVAVLREARSLNESEIERASLRHGLGWFLTKAHMVDLLARLRLAGQSPIRLRSTGRQNIYEWVGQREGEATSDLNQRAARDIVDALRQGVVPERHLDLLVVGHEQIRGHLKGLLGEVAGERSEFKCVRGAYGSGKTFLCSWLREQAFESDFAVASVRIGPDQPLSDLPVFFAGLVDGLRTPEKRHACALADVLESWLLALHRRTARLEGVEPFARETCEQLGPVVEEQVGKELAKISEFDPGFGPAVSAFYRARLDGDPDTASAALGWLRGSQSLPARVLNRIGVRGHLESEQVFPRMRALLQIIAGGRLEGLLLLVDELELVRRFPHTRQRERAYETLRLLIDECGENRLPGCLVVCTGTDQLFEDRRYGLGSYQALEHRLVRPATADGTVSLRQPVIALETLDRDRLLDVAVRVRDIHARAYDWEAGGRVSRELLERMTGQWTAFGESGEVGRLPRPFLRAVVNLLDLCEERPDIPAEEYLEQPVDEARLAESVLEVFEP